LAKSRWQLNMPIDFGSSHYGLPNGSARDGPLPQVLEAHLGLQKTPLARRVGDDALGRLLTSI
jgi:hypothetical protein